MLYLILSNKHVVDMNDMIEIGKVPGKVMSAYFQQKVENLTEKFQNFSYTQTTAPKKKSSGGKKNGKEDKEEKSIADEVPDAYFKVSIRFYGPEYVSNSTLVFPPVGKHIPL